MAIKDVASHVQELEDQRISNRVINIRTGFTGDNDVLVPQYRQLLRRVRLLNLELLTEFRNRSLALSQRVENRNSQRMCQSLEEFSLELPYLIRHGFVYS